MDATLDLQEAAVQVIKKLNEWGLGAVKMLPNLVVAVIVFVIFWLLALAVGRMARRMTLRFSPYGHIANLIGELSRLIIIAGGIILALSAMRLDRAVASMLAGVGIVGIAVGLASKDIAGDYLAGFVIHFTHPFRTGHLIQVGNFFGYVESIEMRVTKCHTQQGQRVIIPNRKVTEAEIFNYSITGARRVDLTGSVSYTVDLQVLEDLVIEALEPLELRNPERPVDFFYEGFNGTAVNFTIRFWTEPEQETYLKARSAAVKAIDQTLKTHGITLPSQNVSLDFGITGGPSLREQLEGLNLSYLKFGAKEYRGRGKPSGKVIPGV